MQQMLDGLLSRPAIVALAIVGGLLAGLASLLRHRRPQAVARIESLHRLSYVFTAASMILFVVAGFWRGRS